MKIKKLPGPRLEAVASFVGKGARLCDVGSDHARLPVWLFNRGIINSAVITDINEAPLERARAGIERAGFLSRSLFFCCDGLAGIDPSSFDTVVVAGMGGETIAGIIAGAPWLKNGHRMILQPNSGQYELRSFLWQNGYEITGGRLAKESGRFYCVMAARGGAGEMPGEAGLYAGNECTDDPLFGEYADHLLRGLSLALEGLRISKTDAGGRGEYLEALAEGVKKMKAGAEHGKD